MAYTVTTCIVMACIVMACIVVAYMLGSVAAYYAPKSGLLGMPWWPPTYFGDANPTRRHNILGMTRD